MRSKLNPDGAKIRILRIQRGWTQEQLAEIAGVSPRTIQRAESSDSAAFETVRAVAAAFETDFEQLLKFTVCAQPDPELRAVHPTNAAAEPVPTPDLLPVNLPQPATRQYCMISLASAATLILGFAAGISLMRQTGGDKELKAPAIPSIALMSLQNEIPRKPVPPAPMVILAAKSAPALLKSPATTIHAANPQTPPLDSGSLEQPAERTLLAEAHAEKIPHSARTPTLQDLALPSQSLLSSLAIPEIGLFSGGIPALSTSQSISTTDAGAVRQAVDIAAKKTGTFISKIGTSVRRVF